jgi:hypothetical protein
MRMLSRIIDVMGFSVSRRSIEIIRIPRLGASLTVVEFSLNNFGDVKRCYVVSK